MSGERTDRRQFLKVAAGATAGLAMGVGCRALSGGAQGANERVVLGIMGAGGRGQWLTGRLLTRKDVHIAWVCDVDSARFQKLAKIIEEKTGKRPQTTLDFREILDDKNVDALLNTTPDHWHALPTVLACQAGKDVYVEKPATHNIWEGRKMIEAARKYQRIVQLGTQNRSAPYCQQAAQYIRDGKLGEVHFVRVRNMKERAAIGHKDNQPIPPGVDYDRWLGPAPKRPFNPNRFHYNWHWYWDYSGGDIINDAVHQIDIARWLVGKDYAKSAVCTGGSFFFHDDQETPDTQSVQWQFDGLTMVFDLTLWTPYMKKIPVEDRAKDIFPNWQFYAMTVEVYGTKGLMLMGRHGGGWQVFGVDWKVADQRHGPEAHDEHLTNFFECIRTRQRPNADIEEGHKSTILCHLGNISYRVGGRRVHFDGAKERFVNDEEADRYLKRVGRKPYAMPEQV